MTKQELLQLINSEWEKTIEDTKKENETLFGVKDEELPTNPEWKNWILGITEGINRSYGSLYRKINNEIKDDE